MARDIRNQTEQNRSSNVSGEPGGERSFDYAEYGIATPDFEYSEDGRKTYATYEPFIYAEPDPVENPADPSASSDPVPSTGTGERPASEQFPDQPVIQRIAPERMAPGTEPPNASPEETSEETLEGAPKKRRRGLRIFGIVLLVLLVLVGAAGGIYLRTRPMEQTLSEALAGKDLRIWYHVKAEEGGGYDRKSPVVSALVFEGGKVTYYRAPEGMTLGEVSGTKQAKIYNRLRRENIVEYKEQNERSRKVAEDTLKAVSDYESAKQKAEKQEKAIEKQEKALKEEGLTEEEIREQLKAARKAVTKVPDAPVISAEEANQAIAFLDAFEEGSETPIGCGYRLYARTRSGAKEWIAFNTEEYPGFYENRFEEPSVASNYFCLYGGLPLIQVGDGTVGGYRLGDAEKASDEDALVTICKRNAVFRLDDGSADQVSLNKGEETMKVEMQELAKSDYAILENENRSEAGSAAENGAGENGENTGWIPCPVPEDLRKVLEDRIIDADQAV